MVFLISKGDTKIELTFQSLLITWCTSSLTFNNCRLCPHCIYMFCIYLRTNSDSCHLQHKLIGFIAEIKSVYCEVWTGSLNKTVCASSLKGKVHVVSVLFQFKLYIYMPFLLSNVWVFISDPNLGLFLLLLLQALQFHC